MKTLAQLNLQNEVFIQAILEIQRIKDLYTVVPHSRVFYVGGCVRDTILKRDVKDVDLLVTGLSIETIVDILKFHGKVDVVGKSFGVIKFTSNGETYDIAVPRAEIKIGDGHTGFEIRTGEDVTLLEDLSRRDFTMNAIAMDVITGEIIDPHRGMDDIADKLVRHVNYKAFHEDPLRMLRAVQFASRLKFDVSNSTKRIIQANASRLTEISGERIVIELEKIVYGGDSYRAVDILRETKLHNHFIPNLDEPVNIYLEARGHFNTIGQMIFFIYSKHQHLIPAMLDHFKLDTNSIKEIKALQHICSIKRDPASKYPTTADVINVYEALQICPYMQCPFFLKEIDAYALWAIFMGNFKKYPCSTKELDIKGEDFIEHGITGEAIGIIQKRMVLDILGDVISNSRDQLLTYLK